MSLSLQSLSDFKLALRQQTESGDSPSSTSKEALGLCKAVHKFHFQLLVLLGSYVKLLSMLDKPMETSPVSGCSDRSNVQVATLFFNQSPVCYVTYSEPPLIWTPYRSRTYQTTL